jgi:hypothetical protein
MLLPGQLLIPTLGLETIGLKILLIVQKRGIGLVSFFLVRGLEIALFPGFHTQLVSLTKLRLVASADHRELDRLRILLLPVAVIPLGDSD